MREWTESHDAAIALTHAFQVLEILSTCPGAHECIWFSCYLFGATSAVWCYLTCARSPHLAAQVVKAAATGLQIARYLTLDPTRGLIQLALDELAKVTAWKFGEMMVDRIKGLQTASVLHSGRETETETGM